jgi:hypothetical protein
MFKRCAFCDGGERSDGAVSRASTSQIRSGVSTQYGCRPESSPMGQALQLRSEGGGGLRLGAQAYELKHFHLARQASSFGYW